MKINLTLSLFLLFAFGMTLYSQESIIDGRLYKKAKIQSINGNTFMANFTIKGDSISMIIRGHNNSRIELHESLNKINRIELGTQPVKYRMIGSGIGFNVGIVAIILTTYFYEQPREGNLTYPYDIPWHCSEISYSIRTNIKYDSYGQIVSYDISGGYRMKLAFEAKFVILAGSTLTGLLIGWSKKKWTPVYSQDNKVLNRIDYNINYNPDRKNINFNLCYKF
ncbi:MAG: hypothetical protein KAT68_00455 [Bacteroidales bacterium]|nr:hypothetical protein [Bacteroidales bacterium]